MNEISFQITPEQEKALKAGRLEFEVRFEGGEVVVQEVSILRDENKKAIRARR